MDASEQPNETGRATVRRLVGVYDADHTLRGELRYWIGARLGRAHCSLCDITHGVVSERAEWKRCRAELSVPFDTFHRDDQPEAVRVAMAGRVPIVAAQTDEGFVLVLDPGQLAACSGSVTAFAAALDAALDAKGLVLTPR